MISGLSSGLAHGIYHGTDSGLFMGQYGNRSSFYKETINFISVVPLSDNQQVALNELVKGFIDFGLWDKMLYIYPFIGGTAYSHKFNLKDPRDANSAYRLNFVGGWTHSSSGAYNAAISYADTFFVERTSGLALGSQHLAVETSNTYTSDKAAIGQIDDTIGQISYSCIIPNLSTFNKLGWAIHRTGSTSTVNGISNPVGRGALWIASRTNTTTENGYVNGVYSGSVTTAASTLGLYSHYIGARNYKGASNIPYEGIFIFASCGHGLTTEDVANYHMIEHQYQINLGRAN